MRAVIQRVSHASVTIDGSIKSEIGKGLLVLLGVEDADGPEDIEWRTNNVPGLKELRKAQDAAANDNERYHRSFERMMDDEGNDGARPPRRIDESLAEKATRLATQYPRAAMYLQAEGFTYASAVAKYSAGKKAMELISTGGSIAEADEILRSWNSDFWN